MRKPGQRQIRNPEKSRPLFVENRSALASPVVQFAFITDNGYIRLYIGVDALLQIHGKGSGVNFAGSFLRIDIISYNNMQCG